MIKLTEDKVTQIVTLCREAQQRQVISAWKLTRLIEKMMATLPAIFQAPLWYWEPQQLRNRHHSQFLDQSVVLS